LVAEARIDIFVLKLHYKFVVKMQNHSFLAKTQHFGKIKAFDENHGFCDFRDFLLSLGIRSRSGRLEI